MPAFRFPAQIRHRCGAPAEAPADTHDADFVLDSGGELLHGRYSEPLDVPSLAQAGADRLVAAVRHALRGRDDSIVCGVIPFEQDTPAELFLSDHPTRLPSPLLGTAGPTDVSEDGTWPDDQPAIVADDDARYRQIVADALRYIESREVDKIVLARAVDIAIEADPGLTWWRSLTANAAAHCFAARLGDGILVGASPEMVAQMTSEGFATHPLAGSVRRGPTLTETRSRGLRLLDSPKDHHEHHFVVDHIVERLQPVMGRIRVPWRPTLLATDAMLHLGTRITGTPADGVDVLRAALAIHPTPAVCGVPTRRAASLIRELELEPRGAYAGLVGWSDGNGNGRWVLALRCAHLTRARARLFAGAGVVAGSTPDGEYAETTAKLRTMSLALTHPARREPATQGEAP